MHTNRAGPPLALASLLLLSACGEDGRRSGSQPIILPPMATPAPSPTPLPTPTPPPIVSQALLAGAAAGDTLVGLVPCASGDFDVSADEVATSRGQPAPIKWENFFALKVLEKDDYVLDLNGMGGPSFTPSQKRPSYVAVDRFAQGASLFDIARKPSASLDYATFGMLRQDAVTCFFAATLPPSPSATYYQIAQYGDGQIDGLVQKGNGVMRLFGSPARATITPDGSYNIVLELGAVPRAFADPAGQTRIDLGRAEAIISLNDRHVGEGVMTGPSGISGRIKVIASGSFYAAMVMQFELRNVDGDVIWGVAALDGNLI